MARLKFYGWGEEGTGLDDAERGRLFAFLADKLGVEGRARRRRLGSRTSPSRRRASPLLPRSPAS